jgi:hypothetical protein
MKKILFVGMAGLITLLIAVALVIRSSNVDHGTSGGDGSGRDAGITESAGKDLSGGSAASPAVDSEAAVPPSEGYSEENLSDPVKALLGLDGGKHNYNSLEAAIHQLSKDLPADDVAALRDMLTWPNDRFPEGMRPIEINAVKNDVLDRLLRQIKLPEGIGLQMVEMASNSGNDPVWRDYCIQFMQPFYERFAAERDLTTEGTKEQRGMASSTSESSSNAGGEKLSVDELAVIHDAMFQALEERGSTIAGTSLIGLEMLSRTHDEFDREAIVSKAVEIAADETASAASRMTALRLAAAGNLKPETGNLNSAVAETADGNLKPETGNVKSQVAETARVLAQTGETVLLRSAAIVTLGETGSEDDRELLESFTVSDNKQIAAAAKQALEKLDAP